MSELPYTWGARSSDDWFDRLRSVARSVLILDYDGTAAPFVLQRMHAPLYRGVYDRLLQLSMRRTARLVLSSGRPAKELRGLIPELNVEVWGSNGRERSFPDGCYMMQPLTPYQHGALSWLESTLDERGFSSLVELKPGSLSLHLRGQPTRLERTLAELIPALFRELRRPGCTGVAVVRRWIRGSRIRVL